MSVCISRFTLSLLLACAALSCVAHSGEVKPAATPTATGAAADAPSSKVSPSFPFLAPALSVSKWLVGAPVSLQKDKRYVLTFCATWNTSCKPVFPYLSSLAARHKDVVFLALSTLENKPVDAYYKSLAPVISFNVGLDEGTRSADAWLQASTNLPYSCIVDNGVILWGGSPFEGLEPALSELATGRFDSKKAAGDAGRFSAFMQNLQRAMEDGGADPILKSVEEGIRSFPQYASTLEPLRFEILLQRKQDKQAAYALAQELAAGLLKDNAGGLQRLVQALLEEEEDEALEIALKLVRRADTLYQRTDAECLALQAAILFAQGDVAAAVEVQNLAIRNAQSKKERIALKKTLKQYSAPPQEEPEEEPAAAEDSDK